MLGFGQDSLIPLSLNPYLKDNFVTKSGNSIDSTFQYNYSNLDLPIFDEFSTNKWVDYHKNYLAAGVTSTLYYQILDPGTVLPTDPALGFCDSTRFHHDTIVILDGDAEKYSTYFNSGTDLIVNDLNNFPIAGEQIMLFNECYVIIDSIIDGVPDPTQDTIFYLPNYVQDSARVFFADITSADQIWIDNYACHNYRMPINPPSLGVATFDGVDETGYPYSFGGQGSYGNADYLTSKPVNLSGKTDVFLSFVYQAKGFGNSPDPIDSLILEMYAPDPNVDTWFNVWDVSGDVADDEWHTAHIEIDASVFLMNGFQFRFRNKASLAGNLDHWHIDFVDLRDNSSDDDTVINDLAISYPIETFLQTYTAVPWDHYNNLSNPSDHMRLEYDMLVINNATTPSLTNAGNLEIDGNTFGLPVANLNWEIGQNSYPFNVGNQPYVFPQNSSIDLEDYEVKMNIATSTTPNNQHAINDTTYFTQSFRNFYAYDDGTAESGYGLLDENSELAYKFEAYEADTLTGVLMKFVPNVMDVTGNVFLLTIWDDNNGVPGNIIYQDDFFDPHFPDYAAAKDQYHYYTFNDGIKVVVPKTFYVGWEQIEDDNLYIGFDRNNNNQDRIFYNNGGSWNNGSFAGSLIIRPVFSTTLNYTLNNIVSEVEALSIYPNPTSDILNIDGMPELGYVKIFDISGKEILHAFQNRIECGHLINGFYIVSVFNSNGNLVHSDKIIKQ